MRLRKKCRQAGAPRQPQSHLVQPLGRGKLESLLFGMAIVQFLFQHKALKRFVIGLDPSCARQIAPCLDLQEVSQLDDDLFITVAMGLDILTGQIGQGALGLIGMTFEDQETLFARQIPCRTPDPQIKPQLEWHVHACIFADNICLTS